jgi:hypothetical protein
MPVRAKEVEEMAGHARISKGTLGKAASSLGVKRQRLNKKGSSRGSGEWWWSLPQAGGASQTDGEGVLEPLNLWTDSAANSQSFKIAPQVNLEERTGEGDSLQNTSSLQDRPSEPPGREKEEETGKEAGQGSGKE